MIIWADVRIPVRIEPGRAGRDYATSPLIKGLLVPIQPGESHLADITIGNAIEAMGLAAVEARQYLVNHDVDAADKRTS